MTPHEFIQKWQAAQLSERSACQQHFLDLCDLLGQPKPAAADPEGAWYAFERGVRKTEGGHGWADVWMRGHFGWEYKGRVAKGRSPVETQASRLLLRDSASNTARTSKTRHSWSSATSTTSKSTPTSRAR